MKAGRTADVTVRRVVGNSVWLAVAETVGRGSSLLAIVYVSRVLAPQGMGLVEFGLAVHAAMSVVTTGGTEALLTRDGARSAGGVERLAGENLILGWVQFVPVFAAFLGLQALLGRPADLIRAAAVFGAAAALAPLGMRFAFVAGERARMLGVGTIAGLGAYLSLCLLLVRGPGQALRVGGAFVAAMALRHGVQFAALVRRHGWPVLALRGLAPRLRLTLALGMGSVARGLLLSVDVLVLGLLCAPADVASYGLAAKVPLFLASLAGFHYMALFPTLARAMAAGDDRRAAALQSTSIAAMVGVALPGAVCIGWASGDLVSLLFTNRFAAAGPLLAVLVWRVPVAAVRGALRTALWAHDPAEDARVAVVVLLVTLGGLPPAIAWRGALGAAAWMVVCEVAALGAYAWAAGPAARPIPSRQGGARIGLALVVTGGLLAAVPAAHGVAAVATALLVWAAGAGIATAPHARRVAGAWRG